MKKESIKTAVIVALVLVIIIGGSFVLSLYSGKGVLSTSSSYANTMGIEEEAIKEEEQADLTMIEIGDYLNLKAGSELSIIYIARPTCGYCQLEEPIVKNLVYLYGIQVNYLNTDELDQEGFDQLIGSDEYFSSGFGTPLILLVKDNVIVNKASGYHSKAELIDFFTTNGVI